jgi:hypothetical protein
MHFPFWHLRIGQQTPPHRGRSAGHVVIIIGQAPPRQAWPAGQALPHAPQFAGSLFTFVHTLLHLICMPGQPGAMQLPPWQTCPAAQALPQAPQFAGLLFTFVHTPLQRI